MLRNQDVITHWNKAIEYTRSRSPASFEQWFSSVQFDQLDEGVLKLTARDGFVRDWVKAHFLPDLITQLDKLLGQPGEQGIRVQWSINSDLENPVCAAKVSRSVPPPPPRPVERPVSVPPSRPAFTVNLNPKYTFSNFVVGPSNELAHAAALASAGGGGPRYNPLFIAGGTGLGKTHLMHAIAHKVLEGRPVARIVYVSAEHFTNEFIEALQHHKMDDFRTRYRTDCDLLLLDDIQFLAGREQTQEEFFHTFNALHDAD